jgi:hypothetical protein
MVQIHKGRVERRDKEGERSHNHKARNLETPPKLCLHNGEMEDELKCKEVHDRLEKAGTGDILTKDAELQEQYEVLSFIQKE